MSEKKSPFCTLTDSELSGKADQLIQELIDTGGKSFTMQVPARPNADTDLIFAELNNRFKKLITGTQPGAVHIHKESVEENWESFWKPIVTNEDGTINIEQVKKELADFSFIMEQVPKVYCHITGSRMSKVMYHADTVISVADDYFNEQLEEAVKVEVGEQPGAAWVKGHYDRLYDQLKSGKRSVCYVDYRWDTDMEPCRDICTIREGHMEFSARGISYGGVAYIRIDENEKEEFISECERLNVEWLDEGTVAGREEDAVGFAEWIRTFEALDKQHGYWVLESQITTAQLYEKFKQQKEG